MTRAFDINDNGWIVGEATNRSTGATHGFLLSVIGNTQASVVPEPHSAALLITALGLMGAARGVKRGGQRLDGCAVQ